MIYSFVIFILCLLAFFFCCVLLFVFFFFFFFSSRRRHTRYIGDWSSDVCSSDLRARRWVWSNASGLPSPSRSTMTTPSALPSGSRPACLLTLVNVPLPLLQIGRASCRERV